MGRDFQDRVGLGLGILGSVWFGSTRHSDPGAEAGLSTVYKLPNIITPIIYLASMPFAQHMFLPFL